MEVLRDDGLSNEGHPPPSAGRRINTHRFVAVEEQRVSLCYPMKPHAPHPGATEGSGFRLPLSISSSQGDCVSPRESDKQKKK